MSCTTLRPQALQFLGLDVSPLTDSKLPRENSSTCSNLGSFDPHPVPGLPHSTWFLRRLLVTGDPVVTTVPSIAQWYPTNTLYFIYMIFLPLYRVPLYSRSWTWFVPTTRSQWLPQTFPKLPLPPHSDTSNLSKCPLVSAMPHKHFNGLWTKYFVVSPLLMTISTTSSSQVLHLSNISRT